VDRCDGDEGAFHHREVTRFIFKLSLLEIQTKLGFMFEISGYSEN